MQLERLAVQLRLRNPGEAIDLGFAMVRTWAASVYTSWLILFVPLCVLAMLALPPLWAVLLVWWLKPVLDRVMLHVLAAGVFGDLPRLRETLRALPRALTPGLIASLTWYRLFLVRSFNLPVWQLERQTGAQARQRRRQLHRRASGHAFWLTIACLLFEVVLALSGIALVDLLGPVLDNDEFQFFQVFDWDDRSLQRIVVCAMVFAAMTIVEPFYVAGGFALYLNRRTALEGWDLEVALRRMGERARRAARGTGLAPAALALVLAGLLALQAPAPGHAQEAPAAGDHATAAPPPSPLPAEAQTQAAQAAHGPPPSQRTAAREIKQILERPEFDEYRERVGLEYLGKRAQAKPRQRTGSPGWAAFIEGLAQVLRILAYAAVALAVGFLLYFLLRRLDLIRRERSSYVPPDTLFGLDVRPESLPQDVAAAALALARAGELLRATSLLYRGALVTLLHRDGVELAGGDTEDDCLRKSRPQLSAAALAYFGRLLGAWQRLAYARRQVPRAEVEALCSDWRTHFAAGSGGAT